LNTNSNPKVDVRHKLEMKKHNILAMAHWILSEIEHGYGDRQGTFDPVAFEHAELTLKQLLMQDVSYLLDAANLPGRANGFINDTAIVVAENFMGKLASMPQERFSETPPSEPPAPTKPVPPPASFMKRYRPNGAQNIAEPHEAADTEQSR
jgi:hypothetical protein